MSTNLPQSQPSTILDLPAPPATHSGSVAVENTLLFPSFTTSTAWALGTAIRERLLEQPTPCLVRITLASGVVAFACATHAGTTPDNEAWVRRKHATVMRWGCSSWAMGRKFEGDERAFAAKYGLDGWNDYAIHGGAVPVRVQGVEGVQAVVVVSGLRQEQDHMVVVVAMRLVIQGLS